MTKCVILFGKSIAQDPSWIHWNQIRVI